LMKTCNLHLSHIVSICNSDKLPILVVFEVNLSLLCIGKVLDGMSSFKIGDTSLLVGKVIECSKVHEEYIFFWWIFEFSWNDSHISGGSCVLNHMLSRHCSFTFVVHVCNGSKLSLFIVVQHHFTSFVILKILDSVCSFNLEVSTLLVHEIVESNKVHKLILSWCHIHLPRVLSIIELMES